MIDIDCFDILRNARCFLKHTSRDNHDGGVDNFLMDSMIPVINFDDVKDAYVKGLGLKESPSSNDALYIHGEDLFFIEFKAGNVQNKIHGVKRKIFDSLLIFTDIVGKGISYTRENMSYILVYKEEKNPLTEKERQEMQDSPSRVAIGMYFSEKKAKKHFIRFGLARFERLCFKRVYTVSKEVFEEEFIAKWR